tara:strand:- start:1284 stop:1982 length:699 start_codon:yes stop_codon:yes gene_type:complete
MEDNKINILQKGYYLKNQLENTGWEHIINRWIEDENYFSVMSKLINLSNANKKFGPKLKDWLKPFIECHYDDTKVIFINIGPYNKLHDADGIPFSCSNTNEEHSLLAYIFDALADDYPGYNRDVDLSRWCKQGVLMLNLAMTVEINTTNNHFGLWEPFMKHVLKKINDNKSELIVVLFGNKTHTVKTWLSKQTIIDVKHPATATYNGKWDSKNIFSLINEKLINKNKKPIEW